MSAVTFRFWRQAQPTSAFQGKLFFTPNGLKKDIAGSVLLGQYGINVNFSERVLEAVKVTINGQEVSALIPKSVNGKSVYSESQVDAEVEELANAAVQAFWSTPNISSATMQMGQDNQPEVVSTTISHTKQQTVKAIRGAQEAIEQARLAQASAPATATAQEAAAEALGVKGAATQDDSDNPYN